MLPNEKTACPQQDARQIPFPPVENQVVSLTLWFLISNAEVLYEPVILWQTWKTHVSTAFPWEMWPC